MANSTADGSVVIDVDMNVSQAEKRLGKLRGDIKKTEKEISDMTKARDEARQKSTALGGQIEEERRKLEEIKQTIKEIQSIKADKTISSSAREAAVIDLEKAKQEYADQNTRVKSLEAEWKKLENSVDRYDSKIAASTQKLSEQKTEAGVLTQEIDEAVRKQNGFSRASAAADKAIGRIGRRILGLAASALVFNVISRALTSLQQLTMKYIKTNDEARSAIAQLKGALLTLAQPLIEVIIPVFTLFVNILTSIITAVAQLVSSLFGKTVQQSKDGAKALHKEANAIGAVGEAADEAAGSLAGFDEINSISTENAKGASGSSTGDEIMPDFDFTPGKYKDIIDELMVYLSGALLVIGAILLFSGANIPLGLGLMVLGAAVLADEIAENWGAVDGKVKEAVNRMLIILGSALLVIGAILAFSGANVPLGIGLMIVGAAMLATAAALNWNSLSAEVQHALATLLQIIGVMIAVIGVLLAVTGHLALGIGLIIAGIAIFEAGGAAKEDGNFLENIRARLSEALAIIGGLIAVVGVILLVTGNVLLGLGLIVAGIAVFEYSTVQDDEGMTVQEKIKAVLEKTVEIVGPLIAIIGLLLIVTGNFLLGLALFVAGVALFEYSEIEDDSGITMQEKITTVLKKTLDAVSPMIAIVGLILLLVPGQFLVGLALLITGIAIFEYSKVKDDGGMSVQEKIETVLKNTLKIASSFLLVLGLILLLIPPMWPTAIALIAAGVVGLVTAKAIIDVPKGCCLTIALENTSTQAITTQNVNIIVDRVA